MKILVDGFWAKKERQTKIYLEDKGSKSPEK
jgi:hypothetical protein